jgi:hypothetical protein
MNGGIWTWASGGTRAAGEGLLLSQFHVEQVGPQTIEPITGCDIDLPLPAGATRIIKLPELVGFDSAGAPQDISAFYQAALAEGGWAPAGEPQLGDGVILLTYGRDGQSLEINIEAKNGGARVELISSTE